MTNQPIDRGWAWVTCFAAGMQAFFVIGGLKSMGVLFVDILELFDAPRSLAALMLGLVAGGFAVSSILSNALSVVLGIRAVVIGGGMLFSLSLFMGMLALNLGWVIVWMGLITGLSFGAMLTPAILMLSKYFDKKKSLANGLALAGSSIGQLTLPYLITFSITEFGFKGGILIYAGASLNALPAAMLLRSVDFWGKAPRSTHTLLKHEKCHVDEGGDVSPNGQVETKCHADEGDEVSPNAQVKTKPELNGSEKNIYHSRTSINSCDARERLSSFSSVHRSRRSLRTHSFVEPVGESVVPGISVENLAIAVTEQKPSKCLGLSINKMSVGGFCKLIFDPSLIRSPTMWLLVLALGFGDAGFLDALLHLPALAYEIFNDKYKGALLIGLVGVFDIAGRIGGGWFSDLGYMTRTTLTAAVFILIGTGTVLAMFAPTFEVLLVLCIVMGAFGGIYRVLLPVIVEDLFGHEKVGQGIGMLCLALGLFILPVPSLLGYMKKNLGSYKPAMQLCGGFLLLAAALLIILEFVKKHDPAVVEQKPLRGMGCKKKPKTSSKNNENV